tara:strand:+ start:107 stop:325 length:219 start_codon:yes stop_codon:yes gene_type:complete
MYLIDKILLKFLGYIDVVCSGIENLVIEKPKSKIKKKKKCKNCHCNCHCKDELHTHHWDKDLCICDNCKCGA